MASSPPLFVSAGVAHTGRQHLGQVDQELFGSSGEPLNLWPEPSTRLGHHGPARPSSAKRRKVVPMMARSMDQLRYLACHYEVTPNARRTDRTIGAGPGQSAMMTSDFLTPGAPRCAAIGLPWQFCRARVQARFATEFRGWSLAMPAAWAMLVQHRCMKIGCPTDDVSADRRPAPGAIHRLLATSAIEYRTILLKLIIGETHGIA
jgi:hypothetical protein